VADQRQPLQSLKYDLNARTFGKRSKLCGPPARCGFDWIIRIHIDSIGENDAFMLFRQPFIVGRHPIDFIVAGGSEL
jgi:hypothetical protein